MILENSMFFLFPSSNPMLFMPGYLLDHVRCAGASKLVVVHRRLHLWKHGMVRRWVCNIFSEPTHKTNLLRTNISHPKAVGKMIFLSHWWDMLVPGRVLMMYPICSNINQKRIARTAIQGTMHGRAVQWHQKKDFNKNLFPNKTLAWDLPSLKLAFSTLKNLKINAWKMYILFGSPIFKGDLLVSESVSSLQICPRNTSSETNKATNGTEPDLNVGFQGLAWIHCQSYNPVWVLNQK